MRVLSSNNSRKDARKRYKQRLWQVTPSWVDVGELYAVYNRAATLREQGVDAVADHIYPLAGDGFCGLNVPWNLQIISSVDNSRKSNQLMQVPVVKEPASLQMALF